MVDLSKLAGEEIILSKHPTIELAFSLTKSSACTENRLSAQKFKALSIIEHCDFASCDSARRDV